MVLRENQSGRRQLVHGTSEVVLRVVYDERLGYPKQFLRHVAGQKNSIEWEVRSFNER